MTEKTLADAIDRINYERQMNLSASHVKALAAALSAAGFGLVGEAKAEYAVFRKLDREDYPEPFDCTILASQEQAEWHIKRNYKESAQKWLEVRSRTAPTTWTRITEASS